MKYNWQYKLCISPLLGIFGLLTILNLSTIWYCLKVSWFILINPSLWLVSIFHYKLWIFDVFAVTPFFASLLAVCKLWEVWDMSYAEKRLWITLGITLGIPLVIILSGQISKWAIRGFFLSVGYSV